MSIFLDVFIEYPLTDLMLEQTARVTPSYGAPRKCYDSATEILNVVIHGFANFGVLVMCSSVGFRSRRTDGYL